MARRCSAPAATWWHASCRTALAPNAPPGLCAGHHQRWRRHSGRGQTLEEFVTGTAAEFRFGGFSAICRVPSCRFPSRPQADLCDHHHRQFRDRTTVRERHGDVYGLEDFIVWVEHPGRPIYSVAGLPSPLAAEIQFVLQCRSEDRQAGMPRNAFAAVRQQLQRVGLDGLTASLQALRRHNATLARC